MEDNHFTPIVRDTDLDEILNHMTGEFEEQTNQEIEDCDSSKEMTDEGDLSHTDTMINVDLPYVADIEGKIVCDSFPAFGFAFSHIGGRAENQDFFDCDELGNNGLLAVVCDGMGGGPGGRTASTRAVQILFNYLEDNLPKEGGEPDRIIFDEALKKANEDLRNYQVANPSFTGMGTTCVLLYITRNRAYVRWVGDSRLYLIRNGKKIYMTYDHSRVFDLMSANAIKSIEEARKSSLSNQITSSLGFKDEIPRIGRVELSYKKGDRFLLCTDGIHGAIPENSLLEKVGQPLLSRNRKDDETGIAYIAKELADSINFLGMNMRGNKHDNLTGVLLVMKMSSQWQTGILSKLRKAFMSIRKNKKHSLK